MAFMKTLMLPAICGGLALICFLGYSLWLWIKKPSVIVINEWLSNISTYYTFYYLIVVAIDAQNQWWFIVPLALSIVFLFLILAFSNDERFEV